jgi:Cu/Ag efflux pump CusA
VLRSIIDFSLRFRLAVVVAAVAMLAVGGAHLRSTPVDALPEFTPPYVEIQTEAPGLSADEVEQLVTVPLEADLLNGVQGATAIRSQSLPGLSSVVLVFEPGTDVYRGRQLVQERLTQLGAAALPMISKPPTLLPPLSSSSRVLMIGLSSAELTPIEQSVIARWTVKPRVMGVPGVANVAIWGMRDQQLQVQVDPARLRQEGVTLNQVIETAGNAQVYSPLSYLEASTPGTGGFVETPQQRLQVRNVLETIADPGALEQVPVEDTAGHLLLGDVADVKVDHQPLIGDALLDSGPGLLLVVEKYPGADAAEVTRDVEAALNQLRPGLAGIQTETSVFRPADYLDEAIGNVSTAVAIATVLLLLTLGAFLFEWRTLLVAAMAVPVALITALVVIDALGETINAITLAGLALAMVVIVDDAVAGAEGVARGVRGGRQQDGAQPLGIVREVSRTIRSPLGYAMVVALLAILPMVVVQGLAGDFFAPLVVSYCVAVLAATLVALTLTPALSLLLLSRGEPRRREPPAARLLAPPYRRTMDWFLARRAALPIVLGVVAVAGFGTLLLLDTTVVPTFKDRQVVVHLDGDPGMSNPRMTAVADTVVAELQSVPGVDDVAAHVGRAVTGDQIVDVSSSEVWVSMEAGADYDETLSAIDTAVDRVADVSHEVTTYTSQRISDVGALRGSGPTAAARDGVDVLTGVDSPLVVRVYGQDPNVLVDQAARVQRVMSEVDGVVDPTIDRPATQPTVEIEVDLARARRYGIKPGDVRRAETTLLQGILVGSVFQRQKVFDVIVVGVPGTRSSVAAVRNLLIDAPDGGHVRLEQVADVRVGQTSTVINRDAVSRRIDVLAGVSGRDVSAVASDIEHRLAASSFPLEYHAEVLRRSTGDAIGTTRIATVAIAVLIAAYLMFQAAFQSWRLAFLAFATLPLVLTGGLVAALINGAELTLGCLVGLGALLVLGVRNAMLGIRSLREHDPDAPSDASTWSAVRGGESRLLPVLTTAAALAAIALPFALMGDRGGLEVASPMAIVLLGGLVTSTFVALVGLPGLYPVFSGGADMAEVPATGERAVPAPGVDDALTSAGPAGAVDLSTDGEGSS